MSKFKAGDKVIYDGSADNYTYYRGKLIKGNTYTVLEYADIAGVHNCINLVEFPDAEIMDFRFKLAKEIKQMNKNIKYHIGYLTNGVLTHKSTHLNFEEAVDFYKRIVEEHGKTHVYGLSVCRDGVETLIAQSEEPNKAPVVNGHQMEYEENTHWVKFGCAEISLQELYIVFKGMTYGANGVNRKIASITLSSGVSISKTEIEAILNHVKHVNKREYKPITKCFE